MLQKQFKPTMAVNFLIFQEQKEYIHLMFFAIIIKLSISLFVQEHLGITARLKEVTETIKSVSTIIKFSYLIIKDIFTMSRCF